MAVLSLLLCAAHAEPPEAGCVLAADPKGVARAADTGLPELDRRIETERRFLEALFGVTPELVLFTAGAPRRAFVVVREGGTAAVYLSRDRLRQLWAGEHRVAVVAAVLAHQYAHVLQRKLKCVPEDSREEHADLLAGWFLGKRNIAGLQEGEDIDAVFDSALCSPYHEFLATPFAQLERRADTVRRGFDLLRCHRIRLDTICLEGLDLWPEPEPVEYTPPPSTDDDSEPATNDDALDEAVQDAEDGEPVEFVSSSYEIECRREWVPGHYVTVEREVWVPPTCREIFIPEVVGPRAAHADPLGRFANRMGQISEARWEKVEIPGHYETVYDRVWVEGHYR